MEITEFKQKKTNLESEIALMISNFELATKIKITSISLGWSEENVTTEDGITYSMKRIRLDSDI